MTTDAAEHEILNKAQTESRRFVGQLKGAVDDQSDS